MFAQAYTSWHSFFPVSFWCFSAQRTFFVFASLCLTSVKKHLKHAGSNHSITDDVLSLCSLIQWLQLNKTQKYWIYVNLIMIVTKVMVKGLTLCYISVSIYCHSFSHWVSGIIKVISHLSPTVCSPLQYHHMSSFLKHIV